MDGWPDGGYAIVDNQFKFGLLAFNADGSPDTSFGTGGKVTTDISGCASDARAVAILANGKIVVGGTLCVGTSGSDFALVLYNSDGSVDATFGVGGIVTTDLSGQALDAIRCGREYWTAFKDRSDK